MTAEAHSAKGLGGKGPAPTSWHWPQPNPQPRSQHVTWGERLRSDRGKGNEKVSRALRSPEMQTREGRGTQVDRPSIVVVIDHHPVAATRLALRGPSGEELAPLLSQEVESRVAWGAGLSHQSWQAEQSTLCLSSTFCPQQ